MIYRQRLFLILIRHPFCTFLEKYAFLSKGTNNVSIRSLDDKMKITMQITATGSFPPIQLKSKQMDVLHFYVISMSP